MQTTHLYGGVKAIQGISSLHAQKKITIIKIIRYFIPDLSHLWGHNTVLIRSKATSTLAFALQGPGTAKIMKIPTHLISVKISEILKMICDNTNMDSAREDTELIKSKHAWLIIKA